METTRRMKRSVAISALTTGALLVAVMPSMTSASATGGLPTATTVTATTLPTATTKPVTSTTVTAATTRTKTTKTVSKKYEVVAGIYTTKAEAQARVDALRAAKFKNFRIKDISPKFAVVKAGLTKSQAKKLAAKINAKKTLGKARVKKLA